MPRESVVEIPSGSGNKYRYVYDPSSKATRYLGTVGQAPALSEQEFMAAIIIDEESVRAMVRRDFPPGKLERLYKELRDQEFEEHSLGQDILNKYTYVNVRTKLLISNDEMEDAGDVVVSDYMRIYEDELARLISRDVGMFYKEGEKEGWGRDVVVDGQEYDTWIELGIPNHLYRHGTNEGFIDGIYLTEAYNDAPAEGVEEVSDYDWPTDL